MSTVQTCIVLAGGLGTRLREAVPDRPKCLAPVGERSFLELHLAALATAGVERFVLSLGHMASMVIEASASFALRDRIAFVVEDRPLGTGGAILHAMERSALQETLVSNADSIVDGELGALLRPLSTREGERMRLAAVQVADRSRFGGLLIEQDRVTRFLEKGGGGPGWINAGLYRVHRSAFEGRVAGSAFSLESELAPDLVAQRALWAECVDGRFTDIGVPEDYRRFCREHA